MTETRVFERDDAEKKLKLFHFNEADGTFAIETIQDCTDVLELNKYEANAVDNTDWKGDMRRVGRIPMTLYYSLKAQHGLTEPEMGEFVLKWLMLPENQYWRTKYGRLG